MIIDTHCHLDFKDFDGDRDQVITRAIDSGVCRMIDVASSLEGSRRAVELAGRYETVFATVGIHPHDAATADEAAIDEIGRLSGGKKVVAIGEVGLDYYRHLSPRDIQASVFRRFIRMALSKNMPMVLHSRDADPDLMAIISEEDKARSLRAVLHCFSGDETFLRAALERGFFISFTCNVTYKKSDRLRELIGSVPVERVFLETDAPYLSPEGKRGKRNEPSNVRCLVEMLAGIYGLSQADIERITTHNANKFFGLGLDDGWMITYPIRDSLYLNITNECSNNCSFCVRSQTAFVKGHNLRLEKEPTAQEIISEVGDPMRYKEIVFCGYGEPTMRLGALLDIAKALKKKGAVIRLVTNGHGDIINGRPIAKELAGTVDRISVSLNADRGELYDKMCEPKYGPVTYEKILSFIGDAAACGIDVECTALDLPGVDIAKCEAIAKSLGAKFRPRHYGAVG